jgi:glycosyltransferase involved in cell wall biosynthesis
MYKILYVHQDGQITGSFISLKYLIKGLNKEKYSAEVLFLKPGPAIDYLKNEGIKTYLFESATFWTAPGPRFLSFGNLTNYKALIPNIKLRRLVQQINPDLVHINDKAALNAGVSLIFSGIPIIQHIRSTFYTVKAVINKVIQPIFIKSYADRIIGITESETEEFKSKKASCIYNSIDLKETELAKLQIARVRQELSIKDDYLNIAWIARYSKSKGLWDLLEVIKEVKEKNSSANIQFYLVGKLPQENEIEFNGKEMYSIKNRFEAFIQKHKLEKYIIQLGYKSNYLEIMAAMDIVLNCNRLGSIGRQTFETMACESVSISTHRFPERKSLIKNKKNGFLLREGDVNEMVYIIGMLYEDREQIKRIAEAACCHAKQAFDCNKQSQVVENLYLQLLEKKKSINMHMQNSIEGEA